MTSSGQSNGAGQRLVIVESPAKARTIAGYLGEGYVVESSVGHIRDLPDTAAEIPAKYKKESWARLGVNVDDHFEPLYVVNSAKKQQVSRLKEALKESDELYLATDEDREGEAIAWHLSEVLKPKVPVRRMVFHEITRDAIHEAIQNPREIHQGLVDAQETRRILDRLYGYEISPVLWRKVMPRLSAGRVQSVAVRLIVDRERERIAFREASYWDLQATFDTGRDEQLHAFEATLATIDGDRVATGRDFDSLGQLKNSGVRHLDEQAAGELAERLSGAQFHVASVERKPYRRSPYAPFRTTTMQQEAARKLGFSPARTMQVAQRLYENGYITYMRTDSVTLADQAITAARRQAAELYGGEYVPDKPRKYQSKVKNAQEAHEAIRPAGDSFRTPAETGLHGDEFRLYELVWKRTVASQMKDATGHSVSVRVEGASSAGENCAFSASGKVISFHGFLRAYVEGSDDPNADLDSSERRLPDVAEHDPVTAVGLAAEGHQTKPPARYTEATIVRELEEREIGRPSTYASIIATILAREYVFKKGTALVPNWLAFAVVRLLEEHFGHLVDYAFTARMEDVLDEISRGEAGMVEWLTKFYFGDDDAGEGLKEMVSDLGDIDAREISSFPIPDSDIVVRVGRYGAYLERDGERANIPDGMPPDELDKALAEELISVGNSGRELGNDPDTGRPIVVKSGRYGPYVTEVLPEDAKEKPRTGSLLRNMTPDTVTLDDALRILSLPRVVGTTDDGEEITALNGRYGPYLRKGSDSRSLDSEEQLFTITLPEAVAIFAQPKRRGRRAAAPPLREVGDDPATGKPVVIKDGRFGPYITDGETNVTVPRGDDPASITVEQAFNLLAEKRAKGPAPRKRAAKKTAAKKAAKKTAAKKTTKKSTAKKAAKKTAAKKSTASTNGAKKTAAKKATKKSTAKKAAKKTAAKKSTASTNGAKKTAAKKTTTASTN
ncbi:MAG: type I DNA topoisomerase [Streptosporangiales bacterium]|nr:type I DNA topoisomerase [Streptosporangiales bacterium]